jgi:hypothetical protein
MIKKFLNDSRRYLLEYKSFTRLAFLVWFSRFFYIVFFLAYNVNTLLTYKMEKWLSVATIFQYFLDLITENNLVWLAIVILILFAIWYSLGYPIWISANIHYLENNRKESFWTALSDWIRDFFKMFELNALAFSFWAYMYFSTMFRLYILDVLTNGIVIGLVCIRWLAILFYSIFCQYAKYILVLEWKNDKKIWISEAIRKSIGMTISNFTLTFKWFIAKVWVSILFYFKICIVAAIPLLIIYFLITSNIVWSNNQRIIWILWVVTMVVATFMLTSTQAFFFKFWHLIYEKVKEN